MAELLEMKNITKVYPNGIVANYKVDFSLKEGEIHAVVGENGAGKSTLMKILFGMHTPEEGEIFLREEKIDILSSSKAIEKGIGMVHQHFMLVPSLTVAENIVLGAEPKKSIFFDKEEAIRITEELSSKYNFKIDPRSLVKDIPVGLKQKVEILKALLRGAKILILDEPTAVLTPQETGELFKELRVLKDKGHTIIFISHKLKEVKALCDRLTVMRNGRNVGVHNVSDVTEEDISRLMVGRDVILTVEKGKPNPKETLLQVKNISQRNQFGQWMLNNASFSLKAGEILGVAGVEGNGQRELVELLTGLLPLTKGEITIKGNIINNYSIKEIRELKVSHIPSDRMTYGIAEKMSIENNLFTDKYDTEPYSKKGILNIKHIKKRSQEQVKEYKIKCNSPLQEVKMLSGGNIQKVVVAREFSSDPQLLIADQPTRGIDVGSTEFIRKKIVQLRDQDTGVLLISADLNEVMELSDRLIVLYNGEIVAYFNDVEKLTEEELGLYMLGLKKQDDELIRGAVHEK